MLGESEIEERRLQRNLAMAVAWNGAMIGRARRVPPLSRFLDAGQRRPHARHDGMAALRLRLEMYQVGRDAAKGTADAARLDES